jgi:hypothetical protein
VRNVSDEIRDRCVRFETHPLHAEFGLRGKGAAKPCVIGAMILLRVSGTPCRRLALFADVIVASPFNVAYFDSNALVAPLHSSPPQYPRPKCKNGVSHEIPSLGSIHLSSCSSWISIRSRIQPRPSSP